MSEASLLEIALKRDRYLVIAGIAIVIVFSWAYILLGAGMGMSAFDITQQSSGMSEMTVPDAGGDMESSTGIGEALRGAHAAMTQAAVWTPGYATLMLFMWWVMMMAMMLPSASPMILLFAAVNRKQQAQDAPYVPTAVFAAGYAIVWGGFSLLAAGVHWSLESAGILSAMMASASALFGGIVLLAAGIYQLTPLKQACLRHCRSPVHYIADHWRPGSFGALQMGIEHGVFCLGCCWTLMALLFVGGVMNLYWIVGLAVFVLLEKTIPAGHRLGWVTGIGLILWGGWLVAGAL
jgi:predicted metal-binding membrane protein